MSFQMPMTVLAAGLEARDDKLRFSANRISELASMVPYPKLKQGQI
jgi:hypothetical protein